MKANEIMIGDYFRIAQTGKIIKIVAVDEPSGSVDYFDGDAGGMLTIGVEKIEPIPLTAEILEKNGFSDNYADDDLSYADDDLSYADDDLSYADDDLSYAADAVGDIIGVHILGQGGLMELMYFDYVHQLQHALRLCGIDKEIVL